MATNFSSKNFLGSIETPWSVRNDSSGSGFDEQGGKDHSLSTAFKKEEKYSLLKDGCTVRGAFECQGDLVLEGFIEGDLLVHGELTVFETGMVRANIRATSVKVFGRVVGDIICSERIELHATSQVRGNLKAKRLLIQDGVVFDGRCEMMGDESGDVYAE